MFSLMFSCTFHFHTNSDDSFVLACLKTFGTHFRMAIYKQPNFGGLWLNCRKLVGTEYPARELYPSLAKRGAPHTHKVFLVSIFLLSIFFKLYHTFLQNIDLFQYFLLFPNFYQIFLNIDFFQYNFFSILFVSKYLYVLGNFLLYIQQKIFFNKFFLIFF